MISVTKSVLQSLDAENAELYPYLDYLLQDLQEMGTSVQTISDLIENHLPEFGESASLLDLGCGKGAVSIALAKKFGIRVTGIDAYPPFIEEARKQAKQNEVDSRCTFQVGDLRRAIHRFRNFHAILLGSIGNILGPVGETLLRIRECLKPGGYVMLADAYLPDNIESIHSDYLTRTAYLSQIKASPFEIVAKRIFSKKEVTESNRQLFLHISKRIRELISRFPDKREIFEEYLQRQQTENKWLETKFECLTLLLQSVISGQ